ncbi:MAG: zinc-binding dehydrogenase [Erythrobacter sp.]
MEATQIRMREYPGAGSTRDVCSIAHNSVRDLTDREVTVAIDTVSIDPGMSGWITNKRSYMPQAKPGGVMRAFGVGEIVESKSSCFAGGPDKCAYLQDELGLDHAIDYKNCNLTDALARACPDEIDLYFDNVGGDTVEAVLTHMKYQGRIVVCGAIPQYGDFAGAQGPANFMAVVMHRLSIRGFTMRDYIHRTPEALDWLAPALKEGRVKCVSTWLKA